jgi:4-hydroxy-4-methyl-2-oxoglutarate aldolase
MVAAGGHVAGYWGELLAVAAQQRGINGLVIDGGCRDTAALRQRGFPVWAAGVSVHGTTKNDPGQVNTIVSVGGVTVHPGDYVIADDDGVVVIPPDQIEDVLSATKAREAKEAKILVELAAGRTTIELLGLD